MSKKVDAVKYDELCKMSLEIEENYKKLWDEENYPSGKELLLNQLKNRIEETGKYIS